MKAAVLERYGATPVYREYEEPTPAEGRAVVDVSAAGMNPVELFLASGRFYEAFSQLPAVVGREGVGFLDGARGYFPSCLSPFGAMAQRTLIDPARFVRLSDDVDDGTAVALGTSGVAAWVPFTGSAGMRAGESVLVLGASGVVGQLALQVARILRAGRVVAASRSEQGLARATALGADATVSLADLDGLTARLNEASGGEGFDVVLDLLWDAPAMHAISTMRPGGRLVQVGSSAGQRMPLDAAQIRSRNLSVIGFSGAAIGKEAWADAFRSLIKHACRGELSVEVERVKLADVATAWARQAAGPRRKLVVIPDAVSGR